MKRGAALILALAALLSACGSQAAPPPAQTPSQAAAPPPAPTDVPTQTPQPTDTPVPTNTVPPTPTPPPDTPTPLPTNTPVPTHTATPTRTPVPGYPPNAYERLSALRTYRMQFTVSTDGFDYAAHVDEATPNYHATLTTPLTPPLDLYYVNRRYVSSIAGGPFVDTGSTPPPQAAALEAAEEFARGWFDHPDRAVYKGTETVQGVRAHHFVLTWKAGRQVSLGAISSTTYDPTTGDVWLDAANGAIVKAAFSMRVNNGGGVSTIVSQMDLTNINAPLTITPPPAQKASAGA